jgi:DnaK suppressor protein
MNKYRSSMAADFDRVLANREKQLCAILEIREGEDQARVRLKAANSKDSSTQKSLICVDDAQAERAALELEQVLSARRRLQNDSYGTCLGCGNAIDLGRLGAIAETPYCASCALGHRQEPAALLH